jgi:flagellar hook-associated protein 2
VATVLTTTSINNLIYKYEYTQRNTLVTPLNTRKSKYDSLNTAFSDISTKLTAFKSVLYDFKQTASDSVFASKSATTSNSSFITATAANTAAAGSYNIHVDQLAKSDLAVSQSLASATSNAITGDHTFQIISGDGSTGQYVSNLSVTFGSSETNQTMMEKVRDAINSDKADVTSNAKTATDSYAGGASEFKIDLNGTEHTVVVNGGGTYSDLMDEIVSYVNNNIDGVTAEKISDSPNPGNVKLKITADNSSNYISITHSTGFDVVSDLNIGLTKEKAASALVTASVFSPTSGNSQLSITSKLTGVDNRIKSLADTGSSSALSALGLNLSSTRTAFDQATNTAGFVNADITAANNKLNAKFSFNGLSLQNNLNSFSDLITGVTVNLKSEMQSTDPDVSITIGTDTSTIKSKIEDFVKKFNDIYTYIKQKSSATSDNRGILLGQSNASSILDMLRSVVYNPISGISGNNIKYLTQIGITFDSTNGLSVSDSSLLEKKINENSDQVEAIFNSSSGIANTLYTKIEPYLGVDGYLAKSQKTFNENIDYIKDRITAAENRISKESDLMRSKYEDLQSQLATLLNLQTQFFGSSSISLTDLYS